MRHVGLESFCEIRWEENWKEAKEMLKVGIPKVLHYRHI